MGFTDMANRLDSMLTEKQRLAMMADMMGNPDAENMNVLARTASIPAMPENYIQNSGTGAVTSLDEFAPNALMRQMQPALDYKSGPVEMGGMKGYRLAGDPFTVQMADGSRLSLGNDMEAGMKRDTQRAQMEAARLKNQLTEVEIQNKQAETEKMAAAARQSAINPEGIKLKPGERFANGGVESIPGSDLFINQSNKHGKDYQALQGVNAKAKSATDKVDEILTDKDAFNSNFGGYNAYLTQYLPGASSDTRKKIEGLKSDLKAAGLELMRSGGSIGAMTEREWPIVEAMIANISPMLSEEEAAFQLAKVKTRMDQMAKNAQEAYSTEWGSTQFGRKGGAKPDAATPSPSAPVRINNDADYAALPSGATFVSPDGKTRRKP